MYFLKDLSIASHETLYETEEGAANRMYPFLLFNREI